MKIVIDADGCPVVDETIEIAKMFSMKCIIVCDTAHIFERDGAETITVSKGADNADFAIVNMLEKNDIVITQDYGLAAMVLSKNAIGINQNGMIYDNNNIDSLLMQRHTAKKIRQSGARMKGPAKRTKEQDINFIESLKRTIEKIMFS